MIILFDPGLNEKTSSKAEKMIRFFMSRLVDEEALDGVTLDVIFDSSFEMLGEIEIADESKHKYPPKDFTLTVKYKSKDLDHTLAHECVHLKQFLLEELTTKVAHKLGKDGKLREEEYLTWYQDDWLPEYEDDDESYDAPWEIEAYGKEPGLVRKWNNRREKG